MPENNNKIRWMLYDDSHPIYNLWEAYITSGSTYIEAFFKGENPNVMSDKKLKRNNYIPLDFSANGHGYIKQKSED